MAKVVTGFAEVGDGRLYYELAGQGETLVLVHAGFVDSRMWDDQWDLFTQHYRVLRFDMRGFGRSDPASGPVARRRELEGILERLDIERAILLGCSFAQYGEPGRIQPSSIGLLT